jgi:hypothetical protein
LLWLEARSRRRVCFRRTEKHADYHASRYDFVLVTEKESFDLRAENSKKALEKLGRRVKIVEGLPVPDVD